MTRRPTWLAVLLFWALPLAPTSAHYIDLKGKLVEDGVLTVGVALAARESDQRLANEGLRPMDIHTFPFQRDTHFPVSMGHAAYSVTTVSAVLSSLDPDSRVRLVEGVFRRVGEAGYSLRRGQDDLKDAVSHAIAAQVASGTYERLRLELGLPADLSPFRD